MFGKQNATITKIYIASNQSMDVYGSPALDSITTASHRGWFEQTSNEQRFSTGDVYNKRNIFITDYLSNLDEGNFVEIKLDKVGNESDIPSKKWRIETNKFLFGFAMNNKRIRRVELELIEEAS